ncbi:MAG: response regulator [Actinomycetota bacterium]
MTVLVVDDSRVARMMTRHAIESVGPGWTVAEATSGEEALALAAANAPRAALLDVNMPGINGIETARRLRQALPQVAISLLTANIQDPIRQHAEEMGIGFMTKPIHADQLKAFLDAAAGS